MANFNNDDMRRINRTSMQNSEKVRQASEKILKAEIELAHKAVEELILNFATLRNSLIERGFTEESAEQLVVEVMRSSNLEQRATVAKLERGL